MDFVARQPVYWKRHVYNAGMTIPCSFEAVSDLIELGYVDVVEEPSHGPTPVVDAAPEVPAEEPPIQEEAETRPVKKPRTRKPRAEKEE